MTTNIVGEEFDEFVFDQIKQRQSTQGSGLNGSQRSSEDLQYLSNKSAWVKLASSVEVFDGELKAEGLELTPLSTSSEVDQTDQTTFIAYPPVNSGKDKLKKLKIENPDNFLGTKLAQNSILFNSLSSFSTRTFNEGKENESKESQYLQRYGVTNNTNLWNSSSLYGIGGTKYGITPPPGILEVKVKSLNRGSIREATISLKAYNKFQFELIEMLYLRLGFTMMLEWGWDKYINKDGSLKSMGNTIIEDKFFNQSSITQREMLSIIQDYRSKYEGNYDAFFGKVKNFSWKFNSNGEYDITIDLITLGDVIESLNVITAPPRRVVVEESEENKINTLPKIKDELIERNLEGKPIVKAAISNAIGYFLYEKVANHDWENSDNTNYFSFRHAIDKLNKNTKTTTTVNTGQGASKSTTGNVYPIWVGNNDPYSYYIKLGYFLKELKKLIVPTVKNGATSSIPQIEFDTNPDKNRSTYFPNQISLDPRICLIKPSISDYGLYTSTPTTPPSKGITNPVYLNSLDSYVKRDGYNSYGKIMNLYINFNFISQLLIKNQREDNELTLFKFLKSLCDGVNSALGSVNKLEPIIKEDYYISIIDQTYSIPTNISKLKDIVDLEVYGYNPKNSSSNFVKSIDFQTKIGPSLASMISIGATASGGNTLGMDATAFSKWNEGLIDRFSKEIIYPNKIPDPISPLDLSKEKKLFYLEKFKSFDLYKEEGDIILRKITNYKGIGVNSKEGEILTLEDFTSRCLEYDIQRRNNNQFTREELTTILNKNYAAYLVHSFGGIIDSIKLYQEKKEGNSYKELLFNFSHQRQTSKYTNFNDTFIQDGKSAYNNYVKDLNNKYFKETQNPSSLVGFIPLEFNLNLDGISGVKNYNKLNIRTDFLPSNYPEALKFLIKTVDHNISGNFWETSLTTLSIPNSKSPQQQTNPNLPSIDGKASPDNGAPFLILDGRNNSSLTSVDKILQELNPAAKAQFTKFFQILKERYSGYRVLINSINRSWEKQAELAKKPGEKNAKAGKSAHNYGMAVDMNIITPKSTTNRTLMKYIRTPWLEEGIPLVAEEAGLKWGGDFDDYTDCVHFYVNFDVERTYNNFINSPSNLLFTDSQQPSETYGPQPNIDPTKIKIIK